MREFCICADDPTTLPPVPVVGGTGGPLPDASEVGSVIRLVASTTAQANFTRVSYLLSLVPHTVV